MITAKTDRRKFLALLLLSAFPIAGATYAIIKDPVKELGAFKESPVMMTIFTSLFLPIFGYFFYQYFFNKKIKLIIDKEGIRTPKNGIIKWETIWYIYLYEFRGKITEKKLIIKLNTNDIEIKSDITYLDKTEDEIMSALQEYGTKFKILFLDKEIERPH